MSSKPRKAFDGVGRPAGIIDDVFAPLGKKVVGEIRRDVRHNIKYKHPKKGQKYPGDEKFRKQLYKMFDANDAEYRVKTAFREQRGATKETADLRRKAYAEEKQALAKRSAKRAKIRQSKGKK